jgi:nucleoside-diphosphate-sugar epimerase
VRSILITGGAGNIGSGLSAKLVESPDNFVVIVDDLSTGRLDKLPDEGRKNWKFIKADVNEYSDLAPIMLAYRFDHVFHYAAVVGVQRTLDNPIKVLGDIEGIKNVLGLSKNTGVRRVFYSSSSEVYGEPVSLPQHEDTTPLNSRLPYAVVKNVGEAFVRSYQREYGLDYTIFRFFNTYGPRQSEDFVLPRFIHAALNNGDIRIHGDGSQTRTFCHIDDNVDATVNALERGLEVNETVNIGSDHETTIIDLAKLVIRLSGSSSRIVHVPPLAEGDMTRRQPDIGRMRRLLNRELTPLEEGIRRILPAALARPVVASKR